MNSSRNINGFFFGKAEYRLEDGIGNILLMKINYKDNDYDLVVVENKGKGLNRFKNEARSVARDLLKKKSKVNFARNN